MWRTDCYSAGATPTTYKRGGASYSNISPSQLCCLLAARVTSINCIERQHTFISTWYIIQKVLSFRDKTGFRIISIKADEELNLTMSNIKESISFENQSSEEINSFFREFKARNIILPRLIHIIFTIMFKKIKFIFLFIELLMLHKTNDAL